MTSHFEKYNEGKHDFAKQTPKTDDLVKLLPCPFCGSEAIIIDELLRGGHMVIGCKNCECPGGRAIYSADDEDAMNTAFEKWNLRTQPPQEEKMKNVPYADGTPSREWIYEEEKIMTDKLLPEEIWAVKYEKGQTWYRFETGNVPSSAKRTKYIRADLATPATVSKEILSTEALGTYGVDCAKSDAPEFTREELIDASAQSIYKYVKDGEENYVGGIVRRVLNALIDMGALKLTQPLQGGEIMGKREE